jgi:hypothetical protein
MGFVAGGLNCTVHAVLLLLALLDAHRKHCAC